MTSSEQFTASDGILERLRAAHAAYRANVAPSYDDVLHEVAKRAEETGSLGKLDIGGLLLWKRLRADTPWVARLHSWPEEEVRAVTAAAVRAARDENVPFAAAAAAGRAALTPLPGFDKGDALASAILTAAAPTRMAVYDVRAQRALELLGHTVTASRGRYGRYMQVMHDITCAANERGFGWQPRDVDIALFWLGAHPR
jgi:hypothetical protein